MFFLPHPELRRSKYRLLGLIGQGQFGQVFCAVHRQTGRLVALKNLEQERFPTHKFLRELRFLLSLQHPNIVTCQALEHTATGRYLVMDYCEGGTLRSLMTEESFLSLPQSLKIVMDVLAGLEQAHHQGIVHCDIKPENILLHVQPNGWIARISDFGVARLLQEAIQPDGDTGSPAYMAPERFYGQYSAASDLYSIGILLFELIAGYRPFSGTPAELMSAHLNLPLKLPDTIPAVWQAIIAKALQKLPARRFRSAQEMRSAIKNAIVQESAIGALNFGHSPLFQTIAVPTHCAFSPCQQLPLPKPVTAIAVWPDADRRSDTPLEPHQAADLEQTRYRVCLVIDRQMSAATWPVSSLFAAADPLGKEGLQPKIESVIHSFDQPIEQLLVRPQGCFVVTQRSLHLWPNAADKPSPVMDWQGAASVAIDPQGKWFATVAKAADRSASQLAVGAVAQQRFQVNCDLPIELHPGSTLLAIDSKHLALMVPQARQTVLHLLSRRGTRMGEIPIALSLRQVALAHQAYQLLAVDDQPGTLLLIDLKPFRVKRLWVETTPKFLAAIPWGYVLGTSAGTVIFLDQEGRSIGLLDSPEPLTAMTLVQPQGLLLATWNGQAGNLYGFDLRTIGLDLVF